MAKYADRDLAMLLKQLEETIYGGKTIDNSLYKNISRSSEKLRRNKNKGANDNGLAPLYKK
jgi:hypothetical protein